MIKHPSSIATALFHTPTNAATLFWMAGCSLCAAYLIAVLLQIIRKRRGTASTDPSIYFTELYGTELEAEEEIEVPLLADAASSASQPQRVLPLYLIPAALAMCLLPLCGFQAAKDAAIQRLWFNAETQIATGDLPQAEKYYRQALWLDPLSPQNHVLLGKCLVSRHNLKEAIPHLRSALDMPAAGPETALQLGACEMRTGNLHGAEDAYRKAVAIAPNSPETRVRLGQCLAAQGHVADAILLFEFALQLDKKSAAAHTSLGLALLAQGDKEAAVAHLKRGVELAPDSLLARNNLGTAYAVAGNYQKAIDQFREEIALEPQFAAGYFNLASALEKEHRNSEALVTYETYLRRCANHPDGQLTPAPEAFKAVQRLRDLLSKGKGQLHPGF
jgi:tetratricopeptide (TPR) repeat protein